MGGVWVYSKRSVEDLNFFQIENYIQNLLTENNYIINNASLETYSLKKSFGERLLAFFNIFLAATLLSSFIMYTATCLRKKCMIMSIIVILTLVALLIYCIDVGKRFSEQYKRQLLYREINTALQMILANAPVFFGPSFYMIQTAISISTLQQFVEQIKAICEERNRRINKFLVVINKDWKPILATFIIVIAFLVISIIVLFLCCWGKI